MSCDDLGGWLPVRVGLFDAVDVAPVHEVVVVRLFDLEGLLAVVVDGVDEVGVRPRGADRLDVGHVVNLEGQLGVPVGYGHRALGGVREVKDLQRLRERQRDAHVVRVPRA